MDYDIDNMSLDELRDLRDGLTSSGTEGIAEIEDVTAKTQPDYSFHWDGGPTHNTEWDDIGDEAPVTLEKTLKK